MDSNLRQALALRCLLSIFRVMPGIFPLILFQAAASLRLFISWLHRSTWEFKLDTQDVRILLWWLVGCPGGPYLSRARPTLIA